MNKIYRTVAELYVDQDPTNVIRKVSNPPGRNTVSPDVWGPDMWRSFHRMAKYYPDYASKIWCHNTRSFIFGIPYMLPCDTCAEHARQYLEENRYVIDEAVKSRRSLFDFFVEFHNYVNRRYGKPVMNSDDVWDLY